MRFVKFCAKDAVQLATCLFYIIKLPRQAVPIATVHSTASGDKKVIPTAVSGNKNSS